MKKYIIYLITLLLIPCSGLTGPENLKAEVFNIQYSDAEGIYKAVEQLKSPEGKVALHANTNSIIIYDHPENIAVIGRVIRQLDIRKEQVEVRVLVAEISETILGRLGLTYGQAVLPPGEMRKVEYLIQREKISDIQTEMAMRTLSGEPARIAIAQEKLLGGTMIRRRRLLVIIPPVERAAGNFLEVVPTVNRDGTVTVIVRPAVSEFLDARTIHERSLITKTTINSGDTIVLGGVQSGRVETRQEGIPGTALHVAPRSVKRSVRTVMFLTVRVLEA
jgi:type II secretory pathway component GspD/PulD (secretin)